MLSAGRVLIKPEGDYSPLKTYKMLDLVSYNGSSYIAKKTTTGNLPTDTEYWQLSASGAQSQNVTSNFAEVEGSDIASSPHAIDDVFVNKDGKLLKATLAISIGDTIVIYTNCEPTTVENLISYLSTRVSTLDSSNKKLNGITEIEVQTDLHTLGLGEFYKDKTSFYVTNGPEGVDEVASAIFRLTVESALKDSSTTRLLTLKTPGGKVYTQNYDGSSWGDWEQVAFESDVELKQNITDNTLQTTSKTVPGAINELFTKSQAISNPNLLDNPWFTVNQRGGSTYNTTNSYTVDRWQLKRTASAGTLSVVDGGITISAPGEEHKAVLIIQNFEESFVKSLNGKAVTMSLLKGDGTILKGTIPSFNYQTTTSFVMSNNIWLDYETYNNKYAFRILNYSSDDLSIRAVKLELGSVSTLAMDTVPNYATELLKCQRYFVRFEVIAPGTSFSGWVSNTGGNARAAIHLPVSMRATPTINKSGYITWIAYDGTMASANSLSLSTSNNKDITLTENSVFSNITNALCILRIDVESRLDLSADL